MKYVRFTYLTPFSGTVANDWVAFPENASDDVIEEWGNEGAQENAEGYEYLINGWDGDEPTDDELEDYYADVSCLWTEITKEEWEENNGQEAY